MTLEIDHEYDCSEMSVDRDGTGNKWKTQGFNVWFSSFKIHFENEDDAQELARLILWRLGDTIPVTTDPRDSLPSRGFSFKEMTDGIMGKSS